MTPETLSALRAWLKDVRIASATLSDQEARFLVDTYYQVQDFRKISANQIRSVAETGEPNEFLQWVLEVIEFIESQIKRELDRYTDRHEIGRWAKSITGVGPVIAAGLMAHVDISKSAKATSLWRFAGMDPTSIWEKGQKRPWNAKLKVLCWKAGESFNKNKNRKNDHYGHFIDERKRYEWERNIAGQYSEQATQHLERFNIGKTTEAYPWYAGHYSLKTENIHEAMEGTEALKKALVGTAQGPGVGIPMLPPGHIHARARRFAVKLFLSHYHAVAYEIYHGEPSPTPYAIAHLDHVDYIPPPNWPLA